MMDMLSIGMALTLSAIAALLTATTALTPPDDVSSGAAMIATDSCHLELRPGLAPEFGAVMHPIGRGGVCTQIAVEQDGTRRHKPLDCHRDVHTHRVDGVMLQHRHVGKDCTIRIVTSSSSSLPD